MIRIKSRLGRLYASHRPQQSTPETRRWSLRRVTEPTPPPSQVNQPPVLCCLDHWPSPPTSRRLNRCIWPPGQPFSLSDQAGGQLVTRRRLLERCKPRDSSNSGQGVINSPWDLQSIMGCLSRDRMDGKWFCAMRSVDRPGPAAKSSCADSKEEWTNCCQDEACRSATLQPKRRHFRLVVILSG